MRLKSWAAGSNTYEVPSHTASTDSSGPSMHSSITTVVPAPAKVAPDNLSRTSAIASSRSDVTSTPLPAASPSVLMTYGPSVEVITAIAASTSAALNVWNVAVGTPAARTTSFMYAFEPSSSAAFAPGPNTRLPWARNRSANPSTSGASGPMTNRSASSFSGSSSTHSATAAMPGDPGVHTTSAVRASAYASACSRPPEPTTTTFIPCGRIGRDRDRCRRR